MRRAGQALNQTISPPKAYYERAIAAGEVAGYRQIAYLYKSGGPGLAQNYAAARDWFTKLAATGDRHSYGCIGLLYEEGGPGLPRDLVQAEALFRRGHWLWAADRVAAARAAAEA